jgi:acyl-CoA reductase-like NAD-dependent aldehyde dehydrogenase
MAELISYNPVDNSEVGRLPITPASAIPGLVSRARAAQPAWAALGFDERASLIQKGADLLVERAADIGRTASQEMGKPLAEAQGEAKHSAGGFAEDLKEIREALAPEVRESSRTRSTIYRDPFGVAVCISPWNFPVLMPHQQMLPALAAGNTVLLKPSEESPLTADAYAQALIEVLPEGVLQIIHGAEEQGKALVSAEVDLVVFTGSRAAGVHILGEASKQLKRVILELGGKDPLVVLEDADLDKAAKFATRNSFRNAGQVCVSTERIYVHDSVHDAFVAKLVASAQQLVVGDSAVEGTNVGPMVNAGQKAHVVGQLDKATAQGATIAWRGDKNDGNFLSPVVLVGCTHEMNIAHDETFGPVACVYRVGSDAEAVQLANDTPYGLGASVYGSQDRARAVARQLTAGMIGVNQGLGGAGGTPWVGAQQSGYGFHSGPEGHRQFAQVRVVSEPR